MSAMSIGQRIRQKRLREGLTQEALARLIDVATPTLCRWENEKQEPDDDRKPYDRLMAWLDDSEEVK